jgi:hypothetical protein
MFRRQEGPAGPACNVSESSGRLRTSLLSKRALRPRPKLCQRDADLNCRTRRRLTVNTGRRDVLPPLDIYIDGLQAALPP